MLKEIEKISPKVAQAMRDELESQRNNLKLIASENYCSRTVQQTMASWMTDKYAEGFPGHRFYAGCEHVDTIETEAARLLSELFSAEHAYVQPHSGSDANVIAFWAMLTARIQAPELERLGVKNLQDLDPEQFESLRQKMHQQKLLGLALDCGGHLTHGFRANISAKMFQCLSYGVNPKDERIDYDEIDAIMEKEKPMVLIAGYSAYPRKLNFAKFREIADKHGAFLMVDMAHFAGLVAGKVFTGEYDPVPYADIVTSTTHKTLRGPRGGLILCKEELAPYVNKGCPFVQGGPLPHVMAAKAVAFQEALSSDFKAYAKQTLSNAVALAKGLQERGYSLYTDGTENHLIVVKLKDINGMQAEQALSSCGITLNRNTVPGDPNGPWFTSGLRLGTPALTTRGFQETEFTEVAHLIADVLDVTKPGASKKEFSLDKATQNRVKGEVEVLLEQFPLYPGVEE